MLNREVIVMSLKNTVRFSGIVLIIAAIGRIVAEILDLAQVEQTPTLLILPVLVFIALVFGVPGIYLLQAEEGEGDWLTFSGTFALATAFLLFAAMTILMIVTGMPEAELAATAGGWFMVSFGLWSIGTLLVGIGTIRSQLYPTWPGVLFLGWLLLVLASFFIPAVPAVVESIGATIGAIGLAGFGWLIQGHKLEAAEPKRPFKHAPQT